MLPPFSVPVYEPLPYVLSGLTYLQLPPHTQRYLTLMAKLVPPYSRGLNSIEDERSRISLALFRSLKGTDIALVDLRHETVAISRQLEGGISPFADLYATAVQRQETRLQEVLGVLLPERELIFNEYLIKFDALIWLDQERREDYMPEHWQNHRDALLKPILDYTSRALVALDESVTKRAMAIEYTWKIPPKSPFSSFRSSCLSSCTKTNRTRSKTFTTRVGKKGPDFEDKWPRGRRLSLNA